MRYLRTYEGFEQTLSDEDINEVNDKISLYLHHIGLWYTVGMQDFGSKPYKSRMTVSFSKNIDIIKYSILDILLKDIIPYAGKNPEGDIIFVTNKDKTHIDIDRIIIHTEPHISDSTNINTDNKEDLFKMIIERFIDFFKKCSNYIKFSTTSSTFNIINAPLVKETIIKYLENLLVSPDTLPNEITKMLSDCILRSKNIYQILNYLKKRNVYLYNELTKDINVDKLRDATDMGEMGF